MQQLYLGSKIELKRLEDIFSQNQLNNLVTNRLKEIAEIKVSLKINNYFPPTELLKRN